MIDIFLPSSLFSLSWWPTCKGIKEILTIRSIIKLSLVLLWESSHDEYFEILPSSNGLGRKIATWKPKLSINYSINGSNCLKLRHVDMWTLSDSGFSSRSGLSPLVDLVVLLYEEHNEKMKHIHEIREEIERHFMEQIDQWRSDYHLLDQIIKFVESGLANYEALRSLTQVSWTLIQ